MDAGVDDVGSRDGPLQGPIRRDSIARSASGRREKGVPSKATRSGVKSLGPVVVGTKHDRAIETRETRHSGPNNWATLVDNRADNRGESDARRCWGVPDFLCDGEVVAWELKPAAVSILSPRAVLPCAVRPYTSVVRVERRDDNEFEPTEWWGGAAGGSEGWGNKESIPDGGRKGRICVHGASKGYSKVCV
jgi:hypothetical protein